MCLLHHSRILKSTKRWCFETLTNQATGFDGGVLLTPEHTAPIQIHRAEQDFEVPGRFDILIMQPTVTSLQVGAVQTPKPINDIKPKLSDGHLRPFPGRVMYFTLLEERDAVAPKREAQTQLLL